MTDYVAPVKDMLFVMNELAGLEHVARLPGYEEATPDVVQTVLDEAGRFATEVLSPLNRPGDQTPARVQDGVVTTPPGFKEAYRRFVEGGWVAVAAPAEHGGQGMPQLLAMALQEMWNSANMSFALCPLLGQAAVEVIEHYGTEAQKTAFLPRMASGEWTGTMNLTEPQAGSDLAATRARAVPEGDHYRLTGTKIFITYGEHDFSDNIVHMVLARLPDAPEGVKGISLFIVPKFLVNPDGSLGRRNDLKCLSLEHKLGIHGSPTCVMSYEGAEAYLIGEPHRGLEYMFLMMNRARLAVGMQGVAIAERAYQRARGYARERVQGRPLGSRAGERAAIIHHPDVRRMLMSMKAQAEATRALGYYAAAQLDQAMRQPDAKARAQAQAAADLLTPVVKGWASEQGVEVASLGVQVHGGMGYIEETGAAQHFRDARIATIYEGTTGIQANDLLGRKLARDGGAAVGVLLAQMRAARDELKSARGDDLRAIGASLEEGIGHAEAATEHLLNVYGADARAAAAGAVPYLMLLGTVAGGWQMARAAQVAEQRAQAGSDREFHQAKIATTRFYADHLLPRASAYRHEIVHGAEAALRLEEAQF